jgi:hypothetical protein
MEVVVDDTKKIIGAAIWVPPVEDENNNKGTSRGFDEFLSNFNNDTRERCYKFIGTVREAENFLSNLIGH